MSRKLTSTEMVDWADYYRRIAVREARRADVRERAGWNPETDPAQQWANNALYLMYNHKRKVIG